MTDREAMKMALNALEFSLPAIEDFGSKEQLTDCHRAITALYKSFAQPEQEPVDIHCPSCLHSFSIVPVAKREWVGLTDEERNEMRSIVQGHTRIDAPTYGLTLQYATEEVLKEKNNAL